MVESKRSPLDLILVEKRVYYKDNSVHNGTTTTTTTKTYVMEQKKQKTLAGFQEHTGT